MTEEVNVAGIAQDIVNDLFADVRQRRFLKYLFAEDPADVGPWGHLDGALDLAVQAEIAEEWSAIVRLHLHAHLQSEPSK